MLPGLEADDRILTNIEILSLKEIPKSLVIVGAARSAWSSLPSTARSIAK